MGFGYVGTNSNPTDNTAELLADRLYPGANLTVKFANEIASVGHGDVWQWITRKAQTANFTGLHVGDYIPITTTLSPVQTFNMVIAGMDTYYGQFYGTDGVSSNTYVNHHIDFISRECVEELRPFNKANYNNGTSVHSSPWLASDLYAWMNCRNMQVVSTATANPTMVTVNYTSTGLINKLPVSVQNVIIPKYTMVPRRYTAGTLLTDDNGGFWENDGWLWLPREVEVYGRRAIGGLSVYASPGAVQYPLFTNSLQNIIKKSASTSEKTSWWLSQGVYGYSTHVCCVGDGGLAWNAVGANMTNTRVPICFRIGTPIM